MNIDAIVVAETNPLVLELHNIMGVGQFIFLAIGFALVLASLHFARKCNLVPTILFGAMAWAAYVVPKWLVWSIPEPRDIRWLLVVGALVLIGGPLVVLIISTGRAEK